MKKPTYVSIIIGLVSGFLMFPFPDFSKSLQAAFAVPPVAKRSSTKVYP